MDIKIPYYEDNTRVSRSSLNWFKISPRYFKDRLDGKIKSDSSSAMENGTQRHAYLLQPEEFKKMYKILDFETPSSPKQKQFCIDYIADTSDKAILKASKAFKLNYATNGKTEEDIATKGLEMALKLKSYIKWLRGNKDGQKIMSWSQLNSLKVMKENVRLHKKASKLLLTKEDSPEFITLNEFHINWTFNVTKDKAVECKSLIDRLEIDHKEKIVRLIDIKTTISNANFKKSFNEYDYGMQMAYYWLAIYWYFENELKLNIEEYAAETFIVSIENGSNEVKVLDVPESIILEKLTEIKQIITEIDWHFTNDLWDYTREYYEGDGVESLLYDIKREN